MNRSPNKFILGLKYKYTFDAYDDIDAFESEESRELVFAEMNKDDTIAYVEKINIPYYK